MKKLTVTIVGLLVAGLWFLPVQRANAQGEHQRIEAGIAQAKADIDFCLSRIDRAQRGIRIGHDSSGDGPATLVDPEEAYPPEERIKRAKECIEQAKERLKSLREQLAKLPPLPNSRMPKRDPNAPPEPDPKRKELLEAIDEVQKLAAAYGKKLSRIEERSKRLKPRTGYKVEANSTSGLLIVTFTTAEGQVKVFLPDDMKAGDTVSGSVSLEPSGKTDAERSQNQLKLATSSVRFIPVLVEGKTESSNVEMEVQLSHPIAMEKVSFPIPDEPPTEAVNIILKGKDGEEKAGTEVPVGPKENKPTSPNSPDNIFPKIVQGGGHVEIRYPSNRDAKTVEVTIGGQPARVLAESPRKVVVMCPDSVTGQVEINLKEGNNETKGTTRVVGVRLSALKTNLTKGEKTTVTVEVNGLEGIKEDVPLQLETRGVVQMDGGNSARLQIRPQDVQPGGRYTTTRGITGQQAGGFSVTATVFQRTHFIPLTENAAVNGVRVKKVGDQFLFSIENVKDPLKGDPLEGPYEVDYTCLISTKLSRVLASFKKGNAEATMYCPEGRYVFAYVKLDF